MLRIIPKKCHTCGKLGVGPNPVKLHPYEGRYYCGPHFRDALDWHESRGEVVRGIASLHGIHQEILKPPKPKKHKPHDWRGYIHDHAGMAGWALEVGDRRTFVHHFSRAMHAWALKESM